MKKTVKLRGRGVSGGVAEGEALVAPVRISFWGGFDPASGRIIETGNPLEGRCIKDKVLIFITSKGSSGTPTGFMAARKTGNIPAAIINTDIDSLAVLAAVLLKIPMVVDLADDPFSLIKTGDVVRVDGDKGLVEVTRRYQK